MKYDFNFGVIGYGNMAKAIIEGALKSNLCINKDILVFDINTESLLQAKNKGLMTADTAKEIALKCNFILFSVKPQSCQDVFDSIKDSLNNNVVISIMAGVEKNKIHSNLQKIKVCRCMPNTPALLGKGMTAIDTSELNAQERSFVLELFKSVGEIIELSEDKMNAVTAVSGSGPAYVYKFIKAFINSAKEIGLKESESEILVLNTIIGAAEMINNRYTDIDTLIDRVCSKGGTTIEGVKKLDSGNLDGTVNDCVKAAYKRAEELSKL